MACDWLLTKKILMLMSKSSAIEVSRYLSSKNRISWIMPETDSYIAGLGMKT